MLAGEAHQQMQLVLESARALLLEQRQVFPIHRKNEVEVAEIVLRVCLRLRQETNINTVALSGGVFMNLLLLTDSLNGLRAHDFRVFRHERVPCNDGGLSLGQLAIAAAKLLEPDTQ